MQFSQDINALRAIAVVAVLLFHFAVPGFTGGFAGVDVFFVISGYLMTAIIMKRWADGRYTTLGFYADRARRILPALLVLCAVLFALGWFALLPFDYRRLGKQVAGSATFISNILYWREAGYFAAASNEKWLLHTWSLSVEWQFYLIYPLVILVLRRALGASGLRWGLLTLAGASLVVSFYASRHAQSAGFYLLPSRAWEMLLGGLVFMFPLTGLRSARPALEMAGFALVILSIVLLDPGQPWPGMLALWPTIGCALILSAQRNASRWLGHPAVQYLGRVSYSLYLWHWPVVVALATWGQNDPWARLTIGIGASILLAHLSYRFVELPTRAVGKAKALETDGRRRSTEPTRSATSGAWAIASIGAVITALGAIVWVTEGVSTRFSPDVVLADKEALNGNPRARECFATAGPAVAPCTFGGDGSDGAILIGDSHALSIVSALTAAAPSGTRIAFHGYASCPTVWGATYGDSDNECGDFNRTRLEPLLQGPDSTTPLVIVNYWMGYVDASRVRFASLESATDHVTLTFSVKRYGERMVKTYCALARKRPVYVMLPVPEFGANVPRTVATRLARHQEPVDVSIDLAVHLQRNRFVLDTLQEVGRCGVRLLDPEPYLCAEGRCMGSLHGRPLYSDMHHLSEYGNQRLVPMFRAVFQSSPVLLQ